MRGVGLTEQDLGGLTNRQKASDVTPLISYL